MLENKQDNEKKEGANAVLPSESFLSTPEGFAVIFAIVGIILALLIGWGTGTALVMQIGIFILAIFTGKLVVWNVTPSLHTPLMSVTNAISGIVVVGAMTTMC